MTLPKQLVEGRDQIEGNFIFCLWKDPQFFEDYAKTIKADETFLFPESILYYTIGKNMFDLGFNSFDAASVSLFLSDKESTRDSFEALGGFRTVEDITSVLIVDGLDTYYEELGNDKFAWMQKARKFGLNIKFENISSEITNTSNFITASSTLDPVFYNRAIALRDLVEKVQEENKKDETYNKEYKDLLPYFDFGFNLNEIKISTRIAKGEKMIKTPKGDSVIAYKIFS